MSESAGRVEPTTQRAVVVGVGRNTHAAVAWGVSEAMRRGVALHLVHAVPEAGHDAGPDSDPDELDRQVSIGDHRLRVAAERAAMWTFGRLATTRSLVGGSPAEVLLEAAEDAELVVIERPRAIEVGNRGDRGGPSVSASLALSGHTPFVVVPSGWAGSTLGGPRTITIGQRERTTWTAFSRGTLAVAAGPVLLVPEAAEARVTLAGSRVADPARPEVVPARPVRHLAVVREA